MFLVQCGAKKYMGTFIIYKDSEKSVIMHKDSIKSVAYNIGRSPEEILNKELKLSWKKYLYSSKVILIFHNQIQFILR